MKIIENKNGCASGKIFNIGNPANNYSVRELAVMMLEIANSIPEYAVTASKVEMVDVTSDNYYGKGYQDVQNRVPSIENTQKDLGWTPSVDMRTALEQIFEAYRSHVDEARNLINDED